MKKFPLIHLKWLHVAGFVSCIIRNCEVNIDLGPESTAVTVIMASSKGNIFRVTGPLCGEFTDHRWIPITKASEAELLMFSLICAWINGWINKRESGDLKRYRTHYDVTVMQR